MPRIGCGSAIGAAPLRCPVIAHDLPPNTAVNGLLRLDFFRNQVLNLDFQKGQISLA